MSSERISTAVFGGALAIGFAQALQPHAAAGQLPGAMTSEGLSTSGPFVQLAVLIVAVFAFALLGDVAARHLAGIRWAKVSYCAAMLSSPLALMHFGNVRHVLLHGVAAIAIVFLRRLNPRFSRDDVVLLPTLLATYFAFFDLGFGKTPYPTFLRAAIAAFSLRLIVGWMSKSARPALAFAAAPLAFAFQLQWLSPAVSGALAMLWIAGTAIIGAMFVPERIAARALAYAIYPIALTLYPLALVGVTAPWPVDFFEDGHDFVVASEMVRGERPYADILPTHGFLADGGLDFVFMKAGADTMGKVLHMRTAVAALNLAAMYFIAFAATGSSAAGCLGVLLAFCLFPSSTFWLRPMPALFSLASLAAAVRLRSVRWLAVAGAALALSFLTSLDFAAYTAIVAAVVIVRWGEARLAVLHFAAGFFAVLIPAFLVFAIGGFAIDFWRGTAEVLRTGGVFVIGPFTVPECLRSLSAMIWQLPNPRCLSAVLWVLALLITAAGFSRKPRRSDAIWYVGLWIAIAGLSWVERQHAYYEFALPAFVAAVLFRYRRHRAAVAVAVAIILLARPFSHLFDVATLLRRDHGLRPTGWVTSRELPRAGDVVMLPRTAAALGSMKKYVSTLRPNETFYDFTYAAVLYYLFDRNNPIPQLGPPFYESEEAQRSVIATLQRDRNVRAALIVFPDAYSEIDGVSNQARAPLVWQYLQTNFKPAFDENGVVIWTRAPARPAGGRP
jgi:hypothetical protein